MFPLASANIYKTVVVPTLNEDPGICDLDCKETVPDRSVAVGSTHETTAELLPRGAVTDWLAGQPWIVGGVLSSVKKLIINMRTQDTLNKCHTYFCKYSGASLGDQSYIT